MQWILWWRAMCVLLAKKTLCRPLHLSQQDLQRSLHVRGILLAECSLVSWLPFNAFEMLLSVRLLTYSSYVVQVPSSLLQLISHNLFEQTVVSTGVNQTFP